MADFDFSSFFNPATWGSWAPQTTLPNQPSGASTPPTQGAGQQSGGSGLGGLFNQGTGAKNMMASLGMNMLNPKMIQAPPIQMARPVGPVQLPQQGAGALGMLGGYQF